MSQSGKRREVKRSQQADSNLSSAFEGFSRSLDKHTLALNRFADDFEKTTSKMTKDIEAVVGRDSGSGHDRGSESALEDIHRDLDRSGKATEKSLSALQKTGLSIETVIRNFGSLIVSELKTSYGSVKDSYRSHLSSITAQMQWTNDRYSDMWNGVSEYLRDSGLNKQFSGKDFAESLETVLSEGLRRDTAEELAFHSMISNKLLPAISTNTIAYRRMSKVFGEEFNKNTLAYSKYAEAILGAEGFSEGRYEAMLDTLYADMMYAAEGDTEKANQMNNMLTTILSHMESSLNMDGSAFVDMLYQGSTGQIGEDPISQYLFGIFDQEGLKEALRSPEKLAEVYEHYVKVLSQSAGNPDTMQALTAATGMDQSQAKIASSYVLGGGSVESLSEKVLDIFNGFNFETEFEKAINGLAEGMYQSADDTLTKQEENLMTWTATATSSIARFDEALNTVTNTLTSLASIWLFSGAVKGGGGLLKNFSGKSIGKGSVGDLASLDGASWAQTLTGSATATTSGVLVGGGSLVAGGAMLLRDGISTGIDNRSVGAGLLASVTGDSNLGLTEEEKISKASNTVDKGWVDKTFGIDWKQVGSNALKGTALGTGIGTAAGAWTLGLSTAVGAGVGAISGAVVSIIDQAAESVKYNKLAKSSKELEGSLSSLKSAQEDFESTISTNNQTLEMLNEWNGLEAQQKSELFSYLQDQYPTVLGNLSSENELDSKYIEILKTKIERESALVSKENLDNASEVLGDLKKEQESLVKAIDGYKSQAALDFIDFATKGGTQGGSLTVSQVEEKLQDLSTLYNVSVEDIVKELNSGKRGPVISSSEAGGKVYYGLKGASLFDWSNNALDFYNDYYTESDSQQKKAQEYINDQISAMVEAYGSIEDIFLQYYDPKTKSVVEGFGEGVTSETKVSLDKTMKDFENAINDLKEVGNSYGLYGVVSNRLKNAFPDIANVWSAFDRDVPQFKVGLNTVPHDNFFASLHKGEMVLTAENAEKLRSIASHGSGLSGLLSTVESLGRASVVATAAPSESLNINPIVDAISHQTDSIVSVLNSIFDLVSNMASPVARSSIPRSVITFESV